MVSSNQDINNELLEKMKACTSSEELTSLLEDEDIDLSDETLDAIAGGKGRQISNEEFLADYLERERRGLTGGDTREDIDSDRVPAAFASGDIDGSAFF